MMTEFLIYDLKVAALLLAFWVFYRLLMDRRTFHRANRMVLLLTMTLSLVLPLCRLTVYRERPVIAPYLLEGNLDALSGWKQISEADRATFPWSGTGAAVGGLLLAGVALRLVAVGRSYRQLKKLISNSEKHTLADGTVMAVTDEPVVPFSWMRTIVMNRSDYGSLNAEAAILAHERGHISCHHSWDVVFVEVLTALQWFNPVVWLLRKDLRVVHECEADQAVLSEGFTVNQYVELLFRKATGLQASTLANGMSTRMIQKRMIMLLNKQQKSGSAWLRALYVVPIVAVSLAATARVVYTPAPLAASADESNDSSDKAFALTKHVPNDAAAEGIVIKVPEKVQGVDSQGRNIGYYDDGKLIVINGSVATKEDMMELKQEDVEWINVLGSESAENIYGSRGAKGAIVIKTKKAMPEPAVAPNATTAENDPVDISAEPPQEEKVYDIVEELPQFPGGSAKMMEFLCDNMTYPKEAQEKKLQGRIVVKFVVEKDGSLTNLKAVRHLTENLPADQQGQLDSTLRQLDEEALRVVRMMPKWNPGRHKGKPVRVNFNLPVIFRLK